MAEVSAVEAEARELLKATLSPGTVLTDAELALFAEVCKRTRLDPFRRQIFAIKRRSKKWLSDRDWTWEERLTFQTSIDGFRAIAVRSGMYEGTVGPFWCDGSGEWRDVWLTGANPAAAKVGVYRKGCREAIFGVARFEAYRQGTQTWKQMPDVMVGKCAEAIALRRAFPDDLAGVYTDDELAQTDAPEAPPATPPARQLQEPAKRPSSPPPANDTGPGESSREQAKARMQEAFETYMAGVAPCASTPELKAVWDAVKRAAGKGVITLEMRAQLKDAIEARKKAIESAPLHPPEDDFPPGFSGPPVRPSPSMTQDPRDADADEPPPPDVVTESFDQKGD